VGAAMSTKALKTNVAVVKSPKLPAVKAKRAWRDFDDYAEAGRLLRDRYDVLIATCALFNRNAPTTRQLEDAIATQRTSISDIGYFYRKFDAGREFFEREELYQKTKELKPDLLNGHTPWQITRRVVAEQVGLLIGSFPNANPHCGEVYTRLLIEEIMAANPRATVLEATCRQIRRTATFAPTVAELLKVLREQAVLWEDRLDIFDDDIEHWLKELDGLITSAKTKLAKP
jgi:hypothetical protein